MAEVKFCGLTRAEDAAVVASLGAEYAGVIFAGGPRHLDPHRAAAVLNGLGNPSVRRVGVFGTQDAREIADVAARLQLDVVQLAYGAERERRIGLRKVFDGEIWAVAHVAVGESLSVQALASWYDDGVAAIVLDAAVAGRLGGTGVRLDWNAIAPVVSELRRHGRVVLAGGLNAANVADALATVAVDAVDVSSGVESAPGVKDPERMRAFAVAVRAHEVQ